MYLTRHQTEQGPYGFDQTVNKGHSRLEIRRCWTILVNIILPIALMTALLKLTDFNLPSILPLSRMKKISVRFFEATTKSLAGRFFLAVNLFDL